MAKASDFRDERDFYRVGVPLGSRVQLIVRRPDGWEVWLGLKNIHDHPNNYIGNYLMLHDDGRVINHTRHEDGTEDWFTVKG